MDRVLIVAKYYYPYFGGTESTSRNMSQIFSRNKIDHKILCFNEDAQDGTCITHRKETVHDHVDGAEIIRCGCFAKISSQSLSWSYPSELELIMDEYSPTIVIFHFPNPYAAHFLLKYRKKDFRLIVYYNLDIYKQKFLGKFFHAQTIHLLERADAIVALSPNYIEGSPYLKRFREKCSVIPCSIQEERLKLTEEIRRAANGIRKKYGGKVLCFTCGRHVPYKGLTYLVQASNYLTDDYRILIGGEGPLTESLMQEASGDKKVVFLGKLTDEELTAYYTACDIYCFPSVTKNESFGIALAEAMYFGKPAVTFTISGSGVNYVSPDGVTGIECPNRDSRAYANAIRRLAEDERLRTELGEAARQRVLNNFMPDCFKKKLLDLVDEIR